MRTTYAIIFLAFLPALIVLAHDIYLFATIRDLPINTDLIQKMYKTDDPDTTFNFFDIGYLIEYYSPNAIQYLKSNDLNEQYLSTINTILKFKAFYITLAFALLVTAITIIVKSISGSYYIANKAISKSRRTNINPYRRK